MEEISITERIEEARIKVKTAYDLIDKTDIPALKQWRTQEWLKRKRDLEQLLTPQNQPAEPHANTLDALHWWTCHRGVDHSNLNSYRTKTPV